MLVLSRKKGETIVIGDGIRVTVVDVRGDKVRLGISAARSIPVNREEVHNLIVGEARNAAGGKDAAKGARASILNKGA